MAYTEESSIDYGNEINEYQVGAMIDAYSSGDKDKARQLSIDASVVRAMVKTLEFYNQFGVDSDLTANDVNKAKYVINEYDDAQFLDVETFVSTSNGEALGTGAVVVGVQPSPRMYEFEVTTNGQTVFSMPFDISQVFDTDSIVLTLNQFSDHVYGEDYSITGSILTWTGYTLQAGYSFMIKYWI